MMKHEIFSIVGISEKKLCHLCREVFIQDNWRWNMTIEMVNQVQLENCHCGRINSE